MQQAISLFGHLEPSMVIDFLQIFFKEFCFVKSKQKLCYALQCVSFLYVFILVYGKKFQ